MVSGDAGCFSCCAFPLGLLVIGYLFLAFNKGLAMAKKKRQDRRNEKIQTEGERKLILRISKELRNCVGWTSEYRQVNTGPSYTVLVKYSEGIVIHCDNYDIVQAGKVTQVKGAIAQSMFRKIVEEALTYIDRRRKQGLNADNSAGTTQRRPATERPWLSEIQGRGSKTYSPATPKKTAAEIAAEILATNPETEAIPVGASDDRGN